MNNIFYDIYIMGFRVRIVPYKIVIYDDYSKIKGNRIPDKIVEYCYNEGFADTWPISGRPIKVEIMRIKK
tara:strand:+ start:176 stop:385 length:210 start_codon:yes stop_codon:yes gene_type:complete